MTITEEEKEATENLKKLVQQRKDKTNTITIKYDSCICSTKELDIALNLIQKQEEKINKVLEIAFQYGQIDGDHHKTWVIDQIVRNLTGNDYKEWIKHYEYDEETGEEYTWNKGIAP